MSDDRKFSPWMIGLIVVPLLRAFSGAGGSGSSSPPRPPMARPQATARGAPATPLASFPPADGRIVVLHRVPGRRGAAAAPRPPLPSEVLPPDPTTSGEARSPARSRAPKPPSAARRPAAER